MNRFRSAPQSLSLVTMGHLGPEPVAVKNLLECLPYRVRLYQVDDCRGLLPILRGDVPTDRFVILSCYGRNYRNPAPDDGPFAASDVMDAIALPGKIILNLGCQTGTNVFATAFLRGGVAAYIAPTGTVDVLTAVLFLFYLFCFLDQRLPLQAAVARACAKDATCAQFTLSLPVTEDPAAYDPYGAPLRGGALFAGTHSGSR
ncbi:MAG: hypothetical protein ACR2JW_12290 [Thermomicrobiales bacterium]